MFVLTAALLVWWVARRPDGFVPREVAGGAAYRLAVATGAGVFGGLFATMYVVPQILARSYGWSVLAIGAALLPGAVAGAVLSRRAGLLNARHGRLLLAGTALTATCALIVAAFGGPWPAALAASLSLAAFAVTQVVIVGGGMGSAITGALAESMSLSRTLAIVALFPLTAAVLAAQPGRRDRAQHERRSRPWARPTRG
ncbi:hypothetical protein [Nonomuraea glycinis]|uniref:hypothetical protein n=1 Tax=Nonomuraea glycinis TaxID=2047744 RepID=UPI0033BABEE5